MHELVNDPAAGALESTANDKRSAPQPARTVIIVDDDATVARLMSQMVEECGYATVVALSGASLRSQYETTQPDAVLLDLSLPGSDGIELMKFLAEQRSTALVLIVSGCDARVLDAAVRLGRALGLTMGAPLMKPVRISDLEHALRLLPSAEGTVRHELCV